MSTTLNKKSIFKKTAQVSGSTLLSRFLGIAREMIAARYMNELVRDAFFTAFKIPNSLRKIFAEGALSAAMIPTVIKMRKDGERREINRLMTLSFLIFEGALFALCIFMFVKAELIFRFVMPGWYVDAGNLALCGKSWCALGVPQEQALLAVTYFRFFISFILFISSSSLLAAALQSVNHFLIPALGAAIINVFFVGGLFIGWMTGMDPKWVCLMAVFGALVQFSLHVAAYFYYGFSFERFTDSTWGYFRKVIKKFLPCFCSMSVNEVCYFLDTSFASYLPVGSIYVIHLTNRFMGIPLAVFVGAFSTILLPHFSRISTYAPKRLSFYLLESTKFVFWVTIPATIIMSFLSEKIFITLFLSKNFTINQVESATWVFVAYIAGLFAFSLNKILLNIFYSLHNTTLPALISVAGMGTNLVLNFVLMPYFSTMGLALATTTAGFVQTLLYVIFLRIKFDFKFFYRNFMRFVSNYLLQLLVVLGALRLVYAACIYGFMTYAGTWQHFFLETMAFWAWVAPLCALGVWVLMRTKKIFGVDLYFLN